MREMRYVANESAIFLQAPIYLSFGVQALTLMPEGGGGGIWPGKMHDYTPHMTIFLWAGEESIHLTPRDKRFHFKWAQHCPFF